MGAPSIKTGLNTFQPVTISRSPNGELIITNGIDTPLRWDFLTASAETLGIAAPTVAPTLTDNTAAGNVSASLVYYGAYRYIDRDGVPSNLSVPTKLTTSAAGNHQIIYGSLTIPSDARPAKIQLFRTTGGEATVYYHDTTLAMGGTVGSITNSGGFCKITMLVPHPLPVGAIITISGSSVGGYNTSHAVTAVNSAQQFVTGVAYSADAATSTWVLTGFSASARADASMSSGGGNISTSATSGGSVKYTTDVGHGLVVGQKVTITDHDVIAYNTSHQTVTSCPTSTSFVTDATYTSNGSGGTWTHELDWLLPITNPDGSLNANRFGQPPNFKACSATYQDRMFYGVDVEYNVGTITTSNGSTTVTGSGTSWTSAMAGRTLYVIGESASYTIKSASASSITLTSIFTGTGAAGQSYAIRPPQSELNQLYFSETLEPESVPDSNVVRIQNSTGEDDELVGMMPSARCIYLLQRRHVYRLSFIAQPAIDVSIKLMSSRGCVNNRAWVLVEDVPYIMDFYGIYRINGDSSIQPVSGSIQDMFRDGTIDFTMSKWFFAQKDPVLEIVRFYYCVSGDTRPKHAIAINYRTGTVWTEDYPWELGGSALISISSRVRQLVGGQNETIYKTGQGTFDGIAGTGTLRGTVTSASHNTISDTTATFPTDAATGYTTVAIVAGTGKDQMRVVSARTSATQLTLSSDWTTIPDTTSVYQIGAIPYTWQSGILPLAENDRETQRGIRMVADPTASAATIDMRCVYNHDTGAREYRVAKGYGDGVQTYASDPSAVVDLLKTRSDKQDATGLWCWDFPGRTDDRSPGGDRWVSIQLTGFQGSNAIQVRAIELRGVTN